MEPEDKQDYLRGYIAGLRGGFPQMTAPEEYFVGFLDGEADKNLMNDLERRNTVFKMMRTLPWLARDEA